MTNITINKGTEQEKMYTLYVSFNVVADSDIMDDLQTAMDMSGKIRGEDDTVDMKALKSFFATVRSVLYACLQENHADEIKTVQDAGRLIDKVTNEKDENGKNRYSLFGIFDLVMECFEDSGFLSGDEETVTETAGNIVAIEKR